MEGMGALTAPDQRAHSPCLLMEPLPPDPTPQLHRQRLAQLYQRDPRAEGRFWCSVVTTGVYCRPTCPSRHARPENIRLHDTLAEARATGFRPCARCRPEEPSLTTRHEAMIEVACRLIETSGRALSPQELRAATGLSTSHFYKLFRRLTGTTPSVWARLARTRPAL
ncbi:MAG: methylphosphotriester-DNA--protein-cysteine methyltransferase family protein [Caulobacteraceae bacterium]|nr:MAG: methylphosphotriester-DNA--protein-cysteine methyltransferase family protein [Caulobacteraceae bacterium]